MKPAQEIQKALDEKAEELTDGFLRKLDALLNHEGPQDKPYYLVHHVTEDKVDSHMFREAYVVSSVKPPYHPDFLVLFIDPLTGTVRLEEEYVNEDLRNLKTLITADDVTHVSQAKSKHYRRK